MSRPRPIPLARIGRRSVNTGVKALAQSVGLTTSAVSQKLNKGMTPQQIQQEAEARRANGGMGLGQVRGSRGGMIGRPPKSKPGVEKTEIIGVGTTSAAHGYTPPNRRKPTGIASTPASPITTPTIPSASPPIPTQAQVTEIPADTTGRENFYQARERKEIALANEKEIRVQQMRAEVAPVAQVNAWVSGNIIKARDIGLRIGPELRDRLAAESDPVECERMVTAEVERMLEALRTFPVEEAVGMGSATVEETGKEDAA